MCLMKSRFLHLAVIGLVTIANSQHLAAAILDQHWSDPYLQPGTGYGFTESWGAVAQTFTPSVTGTLSLIEIHAARQNISSYPADWFIVSVWSVSSGYPLTPLASVQIPHDSIPPGRHAEWISADFRPSEVRVNANEPLAIVVSSIGDAYYTWTATGNFPWLHTTIPEYEHGTTLFRPTGAPNWEPLFYPTDQLFREFVEPIPEPSALSLCVLGLALFAARRRRNT